MLSGGGGYASSRLFTLCARLHVAVAAHLQDHEPRDVQQIFKVVSQDARAC